MDDWKAWQRRVGVAAAVITAIAAVIGVWFAFVSMIDRRFAVLHNDNTALRTQIDAVGANVTKIVEDVGYLRGRMDERDAQQAAD